MRAHLAVALAIGLLGAGARPTALASSSDEGVRSNLLGNRWTTSGPGAGTVPALDVSPSEPGTLYAAVGNYPYGFGSGVYKSTDGGGIWTIASAGLTDRDVTELEVAPSAGNVIYVGTPRAVFRSVDGGARWVSTNWPDQYNTDVFQLSVDPSHAQTVYASADSIDEPPGSVLFKTTNGGRTWVDLSDRIGGDGAEAVAIDPTDSDIVYAAAAGSEFFKSTDGGVTWSSTGSGLPPDVSDIVIDPQDPSTLYAGASDVFDPDVDGIYKSTDGGQSWAILDMTAFGVFRTPMDIELDPQASDTLYVSTSGRDPFGPIEGGGVYKSTDAGATWVPQSLGLFSKWVERLAVDPFDPSSVFAGATAGVFKSTSGGALWFSSGKGLLAALSHSLAVSPSAVYTGTDGAGVFKTLSKGANWTPARIGMSDRDDVVSLAVDPLSPNTLYAASFGRALYRSTDGGAAWVRSGAGITNAYVQAVAVDRASRAYAGTQDGLFESEDGGRHWTLVLPSVSVLAVTTDPQDADVAYAAADFGGLYKTVDGGATWSLIENGMEGAGVATVAIDAAQPQTVYAGAFCFTPGTTCLYKSVDGGATWQPSDTGLDASVGSLAIDPITSSTIYAAPATLGVFRSTDGGATWAPFNRGLLNKDVSAVAVDSEGTVYAATSGSGVFVIDQAGQPR
jgi:photosystem II stability/assembly factor-like uncharacterized protein